MVVSSLSRKGINRTPYWNFNFKTIKTNLTCVLLTILQDYLETRHVNGPDKANQEANNNIKQMWGHGLKILGPTRRQGEHVDIVRPESWCSSPLSFVFTVCADASCLKCSTAPPHLPHDPVAQKTGVSVCTPKC